MNEIRTETSDGPCTYPECGCADGFCQAWKPWADDILPETPDGAGAHPSASAPANCLDCEFHRIINDRDPVDWYCDDDIAIVCSRSPRKGNPSSQYASDRCEFKPVTVSCRPYQAREEGKRPAWCPLLTTADRLLNLEG